MGIEIARGSHADLESKKAQQTLTKAILRLFKHWKLSQEKQCELLGLSSGSRPRLKAMEQGGVIPQGRDAQDRVGLILSIHKSLRLLYPHNKELLYSWIHRRNKLFDNLTPLEIMSEQGLLGIAKVARFLDAQRGL